MLVYTNCLTKIIKIVIGGRSGFVLRMEKVSKNAMVCGKHVKEDDFKPSSKMFFNSQYLSRFNRTYGGCTVVEKGKGKIKRLKKSAVLSLHLSKSTPSTKRTSTANRENRAKRRLKMDNW